MGGLHGRRLCSNISLAMRCAFAARAHLFISVGFVVMHDASHSAVSSRHRTNERLAWIWNALALWDHRLWHKHHVFRHHSFTACAKGPDTEHLAPCALRALHCALHRVHSRPCAPADCTRI